MTHGSRTALRAGIALPLVLLILLAVGALGAAMTLVGTNAALIDAYDVRHARLETLATAGIEQARARLNGNRDLYPDTGYTALEVNTAVTDASGAAIPGISRSIFVGPVGVATGQYGVTGAVVVIAADAGGDRVVRRGEVLQESFAKFAYFTDVEPANISFGGGDQIFGPVHTNDELKIYSSGATFHGPVTTARYVDGAAYGDFRQGYVEDAPRIELPETAELDRLQVLAASGNTSFSTSDGLRIDFMAIDLDGDGDATGEIEGFFRVYRSSDEAWLRASRPTGGIKNSLNCGHFHPRPPLPDTFVAAAGHPNWAADGDDWENALTDDPHCYLGGADSISGGFRAAIAGLGAYDSWPGTPHDTLSGRADADYLFPLSHELNPNFKGVIHVAGDVAISGELRGRVTVAATGDITIVDDVRYATDPGAGTCEDILGLFSGDDVIMADNFFNAPESQGSVPWTTFDDTPDEYVHAVVLALDEFTVESFGGGASWAEPCEGQSWGRGCLYLTGGIIQATRGAVGQGSWSGGGTGYIKRYAYDPCAAKAPPPYFPTTGHFDRGRWYDVDPAGFDVDDYFNLLQAN